MGIHDLELRGNIMERLGSQPTCSLTQAPTATGSVLVKPTKLTKPGCETLDSSVWRWMERLKKCPEISGDDFARRFRQPGHETENEAVAGFHLSAPVLQLVRGRGGTTPSKAPRHKRRTHEKLGALSLSLENPQAAFFVA